jgi:AraC family transcriptional regulator, melibiose operon regulatory protein
MMEAYFEELKISEGDINYPFDSFLSESNGKEFRINPHWHYYIELLYFLEGSARVFLGGENYSLGAGDFILINSREVHSIISEEGIQTRYIVIKFDPEVLYTTSRTVFEAKYILPFIMSQQKHQKVFKEEELRDTPVSDLVNEVSMEYSNRKYGFELAVRSSIERIFLWVLRNWEKKGTVPEIQSTPKEFDVKKLQQVVDYLDKHYSEDITAEEMARRCSMSYSYFSRFFKKVMGKTYKEYLNFVRITEAEKLLLNSGLNITEIALNTGFTNSSYFIKQFRRHKKMSPKQFRKKVAAVANGDK